MTVKLQKNHGLKKVRLLLNEKKNPLYYTKKKKDSHFEPKVLRPYHEPIDDTRALYARHFT